jgi:WD40 repeat protein
MIKKELKIKEEKMDKIEEKMMKLKEKLLNEKKKIQLTKSNLKNIKTVNAKIYWINSIGIFPSGNIIIVSDDKSIKIFDNNFNEIQTIKNAHEDSIIYVKDENNFVTCSNDKSIKTWIQIENKFIEKTIIENVHDYIINKVIYDLKGNLYSCSFDESIKIWKVKIILLKVGKY